jgi:uncharacterized protein YoxC
LLQLASGQTTTTNGTSIFLSTLNATFATLLNDIYSGQQRVSAASQKFNSSLSAAMQNISTTIQTANDSIKEYAASAIANSPQSQPKIKACVAQANQNLSATNSTASK